MLLDAAKARAAAIGSSHNFGGDDIPVFLLNVFAKGDRVNLSKAEVNELWRELSGLADDYRKGVRRRVKGR